jgi:membrane-associated phospholipid phosphatase
VSRALTLSTIAVVFLGAPDAAAAEPQRVELRHDLRIDIPVTAAMAGGLASWTLVRDDVISDECRICDGPGTSVNGLDAWFRDALKRPDVEPSRIASNVLSYGVGPVGIVTLATIASFDHNKSLRDAPIDLLLLAEGTLASLVVSESLKPLMLRERPAFHALDADARASYAKKDEPYLSFPSGHGGTLVAMTAAAGTIALQRGYRLAPLVWVSGIVFGVATSYMRIAADRHYFTDVLGGWAIGGVVGGGVPWLFHRPIRSEGATDALSLLGRGRLASQAITGGRLVTLTWTF